jgi:hypothetical protein
MWTVRPHVPTHNSCSIQRANRVPTSRPAGNLVTTRSIMVFLFRAVVGVSHRARERKNSSNEGQSCSDPEFCPSSSTLRLRGEPRQARSRSDAGG